MSLSLLVSIVIKIYHTQPMQEITLHDIVAHIQGVQKTMRGMEQRLSERIDVNQKAIHTLEENMNSRFDAVDRRFDSLEEDLYATMTDTITIRKYVGMPVPSDY